MEVERVLEVGPKRVLVVSPEHHVLRFIQVGLARGGHTVVVVASQREGLEKLSHEDFDLLVLDVALEASSSLQGIIDFVEGRLPIVILDRNAPESNDNNWPGPSAGANLTLAMPLNLTKLVSWITDLGRG